jgi:hypothetical protein
MNNTLSKIDLFFIIATSIVGSALMFTILSSVHFSRGISISILGIGLVCTCLAFWHYTRPRCKDVKALLQETVLIAAGNSAEIVFLPKAPIVNPVLYLRSHNHIVSKVIVEDIWCEGQGLLPKPIPIEHWQDGVTYPGFLNALQDFVANDFPPPVPLKILVRNTGPTTAVVCAYITESSAHKE